MVGPLADQKGVAPSAPRYTFSSLHSPMVSTFRNSEACAAGTVVWYQALPHECQMVPVVHWPGVKAGRATAAVSRPVPEPVTVRE